MTPGTDVRPGQDGVSSRGAREKSEPARQRTPLAAAGGVVSQRTRLRLFGNADASIRERVAAELAGVGLSVDLDPNPGARSPPPGAGLLLFVRFSAEVLEELHAAASWGRQRVMAIAGPGAVLENADTWSL